MSFRVYYADGRQFNSRESEPDALPRDGVLGVVKYTGRYAKGGVPYRHILSGDDYYFWWRGEWFSNSDDPAETARRYPGALILRGQWTTDDEMQRVQDEMAEAREEP